MDVQGGKKTRRLLTDTQCRVFLRAMREFGYPDLGYGEVRQIADAVADGTFSPTNVIAVILAKQIDEAERDSVKR